MSNTGATPFNYLIFDRSHSHKTTLHLSGIIVTEKYVNSSSHSTYTCLTKYSNRTVILAFG